MNSRALVLLAALGIFSFIYVLAPVGVQAQAPKSPEQQLCEGSGGTYKKGDCIPPGKSLDGSSGFIHDIVNTLLYLVGAVSVIILIIGGLTYVTSTGDPARIKRAKDTILYAIVGIIVALLAYAIVNFVIGKIG